MNQMCRPLCGFVSEHIADILQVINNQLQLVPPSQALLVTPSRPHTGYGRALTTPVQGMSESFAQTTINGIELQPQSHTAFSFIPSDSLLNTPTGGTSSSSGRLASNRQYNLSPALDANTVSLATNNILLNMLWYGCLFIVLCLQIFKAAGWVTPVPVEFAEPENRSSTPYIFDNIWKKRVSVPSVYSITNVPSITSCIWICLCVACCRRAMCPTLTTPKYWPRSEWKSDAWRMLQTLSSQPSEVPMRTRKRTLKSPTVTRRSTPSATATRCGTSEGLHMAQRLSRRAMTKRMARSRRHRSRPTALQQIRGRGRLPQMSL